MRRVQLLQAATFVLLLIAGVVGGLTLHSQADHIGHVAANARTASMKAKRAAGKATTAAAVAKHAAKLVAAANAANHKLRASQIAALHAQEVKDCGRLHKFASVFETYLSKTITAPALTLPDLTPDQKKALAQVGVQSVAAQKSLLKQIDEADCTGVTRLPQNSKGNP